MPLLLSKQSPPVFAVAEEIENSLIHFSHARRLEKGEQAPESHKAKSVRGYLEILKRGASEAIDLYAFLCQVTHPAAYSTSFFLVNTDTKGKEYVLHTDDDISNIKILVHKYWDVRLSLVMYAFNPSLLSLKVINLLGIEDYYTNYIDQMNLENIPAWLDIKNIFENSKMQRT